MDVEFCFTDYESFTFKKVDRKKDMFFPRCSKSCKEKSRKATQSYLKGNNKNCNIEIRFVDRFLKL